MATAPSTRSFTALNGLEVKRAILADIQRQLDMDFHFGQHLSYAAISWKWKLAIDAYPKEIGKFEANAGATLHPQDARPLEEGEQSEPIDIVGGRRATAGFEPEGQSADSVRRETGQPVPVTKTIAGPGGQRITVEAPSVPDKAREGEQTATRRSETNAPGSKGVIARRVTARTAAARDGVSVERAGSPPTAEDADKIIEKGLEDGTLERRK